MAFEKIMTVTVTLTYSRLHYRLMGSKKLGRNRNNKELAFFNSLDVSVFNGSVKFNLYSNVTNV